MKKAVKALPILWLILGIIFAFGSYYGYYLMKHANRNAEQMTHQIEPKKTSQKRRERQSKKATYTIDQIKPVTPEEFAQAQLHYDKLVNQWGIGALYIPSADIHTKLLAGMANQNLMVGVGTYYPDQQLGKGNYVGLAHNLVQGGGALGNLPKTALNHVFYATDFTNVYEYVATKNTIVPQSAGELLDVPKTGENALMTLIRCEGEINTANRAIVQGTYLKGYPAEEATIEVKRGLGLIEGRVLQMQTQTGNGTPQQNTSESVSPREKHSQTKKENQPIYSTFQIACISAFAWMSGWSVILGGMYLGLLAALLVIAHKVKE
ncbi:sortase A [Enterococcus sp. AZ135]|uniref:class A sortase n=1 Tax=unclassified Enterococcus TaxID=2608891 RepID=UPI003F20470E